MDTNSTISPDVELEDLYNKNTLLRSEGGGGGVGGVGNTDTTTTYESHRDAPPAGRITFQGYKSDIFGNLVSSTVTLFSLTWPILLLILVLDYYGAFYILGGGDFMLFNDHDTLSRVFIGMWHFVACWFVALKVRRKESRILPHLLSYTSFLLPIYHIYLPTHLYTS